jgi:two-component system, NtrC family, sensor kinase
MKLAGKLYAVFMWGLVLVLGGFALFAYHREVALFEAEMKHDAHTLGQAMSAVVRDAWSSRGQEQAVRLLRDANAGASSVQLRWVWVEAEAEAAHRPWVPIEKLGAMHGGAETVSYGQRPNGVEALFTYVPVSVPGNRRGAIEVSESLTALKTYTRMSIVQVLIMTAVLTVAGGVLMALAGHYLIEKRIDLAIDFTRAIGRGEFDCSPGLAGNDEIVALGREMAAMSNSLAEARTNLIEESNARIEAVEQLRHVERLSTLGKLSAGLTHELGTPLNVVGGRAKLIATEELTRQETITCAEIIRAQAQRMADIMRQFLSFARRAAVRPMGTDIRKLAELVVTMVGASAREHGVVCSVAPAPDLPLAHADPTQMQQVLTNLVMNAIQAMPGGGRVEVGLCRCRTHAPSYMEGQEKDYLVVSVTDTGSGIPLEDIPRLFEPFFTTKKTGEGTGLGLSIAQGIAQDHGGWIDVASQVGKGSCFSFYLSLGGAPCTDES